MPIDDNAVVVLALGVILIAVAWFALVFVAYPLSCLLSPRAARTRDPKWLPRVTAVVAARNEAASIQARVLDLLGQDYPGGLEVVVACDGSTDGTADRVLELGRPNVRVLRIPRPLGKNAAVDQAVAESSGEVLALSDATTRWQPDALGRMVAALSPPDVGCVSGRVVYTRPRTAVGAGFGLYQRFVAPLREMEGRTGTLVSVSGAMYAVRREHWPKLPPDVTPDLALPALLAVRGLVTVYEAGAIGIENLREDLRCEYRARVRIALRGMASMHWCLPRLLRANRWGMVARLVFHKFLRWWIWVPNLALVLGLLLLCSVTAWAAPFVVAWFGCHGVGWIWMQLASPSKAPLPVAACSYWVLANAALAHASLKMLLGGRITHWNPER